MKIAIISVVSLSGDTGGAERLYAGLTTALSNAGVDIDLLQITSDESNFEAIKETYLKFYDLDVTKYDGVISTKAPSYLVRHRNHVCYLIHTMRVFYDMFESEFPDPDRVLLDQQQFIIRLDNAALSSSRIKKIYSIGYEVANRLKKYNFLESEVLHPALLFESFKSGEPGDYLFMPGRLHRWKRVDLVINAMQYVKNPVKLLIAGAGEDEKYFKSIAKNDSRIEFLGRVSDEELIDLYANSLAVPFTPIHEDYGYVTLEAFKSCKPIITCEDSGEPAYFVKNGINGFVCNPNPNDIAEKIDYLFNNRNKVIEMGRNGKSSISKITWPNIAQKLIETLGS
ncbi:MAG: glycosyltransferase family 4 protein [Chloroflexi bacterium]|nr:glycosyltransferase family 4 protein [Chloroflexota bacterium]